MYRITVSLAVVVLLLGGVIATMGRSTVAQDDAMAQHPLVGAWRLVNEPGTAEENVSYAIFHADGTYTEAHPHGGSGIGAWTPTGESSADLTIIFQNISEDPNVFELGVVTVWQAIEADETGETFTGTGTVKVATPDGTIVFAGAAITEATRLHAEPVPAMGTPAASTPMP
jgi:hypothetical protein